MKNKLKIFLTLTLSAVLLIGCNKQTQSVNNTTTNTKPTTNTTIPADTKNQDKPQTNPVKTDTKPAEPTKPIDNSNTTTPAKPTSGQVYTYKEYTLQDNTLDNTRISWYFGRNKTFSRPTGAKTQDFLRQYNAYYIGDNRKVIYLSFDEGGEPTHSAQNMDTLKKHGIKATFFVTKGFINSHPDLLKRMISEGHMVGNHTVNHLNMNTLTNGDNINKFIKELADTENRYKEVTGQDMTKIFRYPEGVFSEKTLSFTKAMGYRSYFWSFAYKDWEENGNTKEQSLEWMKNYYHPGALYLLHGVSKGNADALDEFLTYMESQGYSFDLLTNIH